MMYVASREVQRFKKEAKSFHTAFGEISKELKNCTFSPEKFRLTVYKTFVAIYN